MQPRQTRVPRVAFGYATLGPGDRIRELNHAGAELLGLARSRLIGQPFSMFVTAADYHSFQALLERAAQHEGKHSFELHLHTDAHQPPLTAHVIATAVSQTQPMILLAFEDVTEQRENEQRLAFTQNALRDADRRKDDFLAMLSHELRNPLAPIRNCVFLLSRMALQSEQSRNAVKIIDRQVTHMARLVDDLLDVTRIGRGKIQLQKQRIDLTELVRRTVEDYRASYETSKITLESQISEENLCVYADSARLVQVLSNVLGNAEKFTPAGGTVTFSLVAQGSTAILRVRDSGAGISPEQLEHLFEPFAQAPQTMDRARGGLGLGLSMVKSLVELHGGSARISSGGLGRGTEVRITLPLENVQAATSNAAVLEGFQRRRVIVIEDNEDAADTLQHALSVIGHDVRAVYDGPAALEIARDFLPHVVFCDIGLPGMDGYDVARAFRSDAAFENTYLVALTGYARPEDLKHAAEAGFDEHVAKPPSIEKLNHLLLMFDVRLRSAS